MNKNDCENIGYAFSRFVAAEIASLDPRIKEEFEFFGDCRERDEAVDARFKELMIEELGPGWALHKACTKKLSKRLWQQAKSEIQDI